MTDDGVYDVTGTTSVGGTLCLPADATITDLGSEVDVYGELALGLASGQPIGIPTLGIYGGTLSDGARRRR